MNIETAKAEMKEPPKGHLKPMLIEAVLLSSVAYGMTIFFI